MHCLFSKLRPLAALAAAIGTAGGVQAAVTIAVQFDDPAGTYAAYHADLQRTVQHAGSAWLSHFALPANDITLTVAMHFSNIPTASGGSSTSGFLHTTGQGIDTYEQGAAYELRTGIDPNGASPDIDFNVGINGYLQQELWFSPTPADASLAVPSDRTDAGSVFIHEFGHAFGFNGWRDWSTGALPGNYQSSFDALVRLDPLDVGVLPVFTGAAAMALYGAPVPLTQGNLFHLGNRAPLPGDDLLPDLMNGVVYFRGSRYAISALDLAVMQDIGLPMAAAVPEPGTVALWLAGLAGLAAVARRRQPRAG